jgi:5,10-methylenetetrahydrofolate reductase
MAMPFRETLQRKDFIVTAEVGPQKGTDTRRIIEHIELLKDRVDALNVTDNQGSVMRYPSVGVCLLIKEHGGEPILQVTCRDRNRLAIQADLLFAYSRGIDNVLCLTGDSIDVGDHNEAKPVFDLDSVQLIRLVHTLNSGRDMAGNELEGKTDFCIGTSGTPSADPIEPQLIKFKKKLKAGVSFVQTQAVYDLDELRRFVEYARGIDENVRILAGIVPVVSARMAEFMNENVPGIFVPQDIIDEMKGVPKKKRVKKGIEIAARLIRRIKEEGICDGVHIMFIGREERIPEILEDAGLGGVRGKE